MPTYNKLVRDRIVEIIKHGGSICNYRVLDDLDYLKEIKKKLYEEVKEYEESTNEKDALEELADILELLYAATAVHNKSFHELEEIRKKKFEQRGGFEKRLFLIDVED